MDKIALENDMKNREARSRAREQELEKMIS
jgi:hypothetical protein